MRLTLTMVIFGLAEMELGIVPHGQTGDPANGVNPTLSGIDTTKTYVACGTFFWILINLTLVKNPSSMHHLRDFCL